MASGRVGQLLFMFQHPLGYIGIRSSIEREIHRDEYCVSKSLHYCAYRRQPVKPLSHPSETSHELSLGSIVRSQLHVFAERYCAGREIKPRFNVSVDSWITRLVPSITRAGEHCDEDRVENACEVVGA